MMISPPAVFDVTRIHWNKKKQRKNRSQPLSILLMQTSQSRITDFDWCFTDQMTSPRDHDPDISIYAIIQVYSSNKHKREYFLILLYFG